MLNEEVQKVLAQVIDKPYLNVFNDHLAHLPPDARWHIVTPVKEVFTNILDSKLTDGTRSDPAPILVDRLKFIWCLLGDGEKLLKKRFRASMKERELSQASMLPPEELLQGVLGDLKLTPAFSAALCERLGIGRDGRYASMYVEFLRKKLSKLDGISANIKRIAFWEMRKRQEIYIEPKKDGGLTTNETQMIPIITEEISNTFSESDRSACSKFVANEFSEWLEYNCIYGEHAVEGELTRRELACEYIKWNKLKHKLIAVPINYAASDARLNPRLKELESELSRMTEENRLLMVETKALAQELELLKSLPPKAITNSAAAATIYESVEVEKEHHELWSMLNELDARYSMDSLRKVQHGDEDAVSFPHFISHLFFVLRKRGLVQYPKESELLLDYEKSGLYECIDFEVAPNMQVSTSVERKGWAIDIGNRILPIRKAQLRMRPI